jgi:hypothetical protein
VHFVGSGSKASCANGLTVEVQKKPSLAGLAKAFLPISLVMSG